jgi:hypothetical protein
VFDQIVPIALRQAFLDVESRVPRGVAAARANFEEICGLFTGFGGTDFLEFWSVFQKKIAIIEDAISLLKKFSDPEIVDRLLGNGTCELTKDAAVFNGVQFGQFLVARACRLTCAVWEGGEKVPQEILVVNEMEGKAVIATVLREKT